MDEILVCAAHAAWRSRAERWAVLCGIRKTRLLSCLGGISFVWSVMLFIASMELSVAGEQSEGCGTTVVCQTLGGGDAATSGQQTAGAVTPAQPAPQNP